MSEIKHSVSLKTFEDSYDQLSFLEKRKLYSAATEAIALSYEASGDKALAAFIRNNFGKFTLKKFINRLCLILTYFASSILGNLLSKALGLLIHPSSIAIIFAVIFILVTFIRNRLSKRKYESDMDFIGQQIRGKMRSILMSDD